MDFFNKNQLVIAQKNHMNGTKTAQEVLKIMVDFD